MSDDASQRSTREVWQRIETLHAVTYFSPESIDAARAAGLRGFWMGYFGFRAAPMGRVGPDVVEATFANFAPEMVARSIPDAWSFADPERLIEARAVAAAAALRRCAPDIVDVADELNESLCAVIASASPLGRPMFAANRSVNAPDDPVARLWQSCTTLREHRGDAHVAALADAGVDGCEAHLLLAADLGVDPRVFLENRGWSPVAVDAATERMAENDLLDGGELSSQGRSLRARLEEATDRSAAGPYVAALGVDGVVSLIDALTAVAVSVASSGVLPFPNPMGLPRRGRSMTPFDEPSRRSHPAAARLAPMEGPT